MSIIPDTVNFHFASACNMQCRFCFAGFANCHTTSLDEQKSIIRAIAALPLSSVAPRPRRINFVGGEPTLCPYLGELILEAKKGGLRTSVVTNGFNLVTKGLPPVFKHLELLGLSIDSLHAETNMSIGRSVNGSTIPVDQWRKLFNEASTMGLRVKINTTVNAFNQDECMASFIAETNPVRWKVFQAIIVEGENSHSSQDWVVSEEVFNRYVERHLKVGVQPIVENENMMRGSYAMISPDGRFYDSTTGTHRYSAPILNVGVESAWSEVAFSSQKYNERTRSYGRESARKSMTVV